MTEDAIRREVFSIIAKATDDGADTIDESTNLMLQLGLTSVEVTVLLSDLEYRFGIRIPSSCLRSVRTAGDLCRIVTQQLRTAENTRDTKSTNGTETK